jgi:hypothetical protein
MIRMVYSPVGVIVGEKVKTDDGYLSLQNPRVIVFTPDKDNKSIVHIGVHPINGQPKAIEISRDFMSHDVTDDAVINVYRQSVTGLVMAHNKGLVDSGGNALQS